jgi:hypothetical protein
MMLDPRIRAVLDDFNVRIATYANRVMFPALSTSTSTAELLNNMKDIGDKQSQVAAEEGKKFLHGRSEPMKPFVASFIHRVNDRIGKSRTGVASASGIGVAKNVFGQAWRGDATASPWNPGAALGSVPPPRTSKPVANVLSRSRERGLLSFNAPAKFQSALIANMMVTQPSSSTFGVNNAADARIGLPVVASNPIFPNPFSNRATMTPDVSGTVATIPQDAAKIIHEVATGPGGLAFRDRAVSPGDDEKDI